MKHLSYIILLATFASCTKNSPRELPPPETTNSEAKEEVIANPTWRAEARCFLDGASGAFDDLAVKTRLSFIPAAGIICSILVAIKAQADHGAWVMPMQQA